MRQAEADQRPRRTDGTGSSPRPRVREAPARQGCGRATVGFAPDSGGSEMTTETKIP